MKSASQMSLLIRAKKKKMQDNPDVIDLGGSPSMDAQDEAIADRDQETKRLGLDRNLPHPMEQTPKDWMDSQDAEHEAEEPLSEEAQLMADGGRVEGKHADNHAYNYDDMQAAKGVNKVLPQYDRKSKRLGHGGSESHWGGKNKPETQKRMHKEVLEEGRKIHPKLKGLAEGGVVDHEQEAMDEAKAKRRDRLAKMMGR